MSQSDLKQEGIRRLELRRSNVSMAQKDANTVMIQDYALPDVFAAGKTINASPRKKLILNSIPPNSLSI